MLAAGVVDFAPCFALAEELLRAFAEEAFFFVFTAVFFGGTSLRADFVCAGVSADALMPKQGPTPRRATASSAEQVKRGRFVIS